MPEQQQQVNTPEVPVSGHSLTRSEVAEGEPLYRIAYEASLRSL